MGIVPKPKLDKVTLHDYSGPIEDVGRLKSSTPDTPIEELKKRYEEDGVLWMKGVLNPELVQKCRKEYLEFVNEGTGMLKEGTDPVDGIFAGGDWRHFILPGAVRAAAGLPGDGPFVERSNKAHNAEFYHSFKAYVSQQLQDFVGKLRPYEEPWCLPRSILRCNVPGGDTTPVHYDQLFLRGGPPTSITAWVPIGDIALDGGGLMYLEKSHEIGEKMEMEFSAKNASLTEEERISAFNKNMEKGGWLSRDAAGFANQRDRQWLIGEYEAGDVVFHQPHMIHAAATNEDKERIRVSTDLRFVDKSKPWDQRWNAIAYQSDDTNLSQLKKN